MIFGMNLKKVLVVVLAGIALTACATQKKQSGMMSGDVYRGTETI